jgi:hypothetical protein
MNQPLIIPLGPFQIFFFIRSSMFATGVNDTQPLVSTTPVANGKIFNQKISYDFFWTPFG